MAKLVIFAQAISATPELASSGQAVSQMLKAVHIVVWEEEISSDWHVASLTNMRAPNKAENNKQAE